MDSLTPTHLRRLNNSIYAVYQLIKLMQLDNYQFLTDTLLQAYYQIDNIVEELEEYQRHKHIHSTMKS